MPRPAKGVRLWLRPEDRNHDGTLANARFGSSETDREKSARAALQKIARELSEPSASTSRASTSPTRIAVVIPLKSS